MKILLEPAGMDRIDLCIEILKRGPPVPKGTGVLYSGLMITLTGIS